ncbi:hypothetical protein [Streptomyces sp. NPDC056883]|uniref:hypothetical protein n=1 Tax=Streptomyces sp. NPDC056883 TaxID=3345959 RepID=UPI0036765D3A
MTTAVLVAGLLGSMVLLISVGNVDAFAAPTFAGRITGVLFVLAGFTEGISAIAALDYGGKREWRYSGATVLVGTLITLASNAIFLWMWFEVREYGTPLLPVFVTLTVWSLWGIWLLFNEKAWKGFPSPKGFAVGVTLTAVFTGANLAYSSMYQPSAALTRIDGTADFGKPVVVQDMIHLPVTFQVRNSGTIPVYVLHSLFSVSGEQYKFTGPEYGTVKRPMWQEDLENDQDVDLYSKSPVSILISTGYFVNPGAWLGPGDKISLVKVVHIPRIAPYQTIYAKTRVVTMRRDRGDFRTFEVKNDYSWNSTHGVSEECEKPPCDGRVRFQTYVRNVNNIINVTRTPRLLTAFWWMKGDGNDSDVHANIRSRNADGNLSSKFEDNRRYGVEAYESGAIALPFQTLLTPPPK